MSGRNPGEDRKARATLGACVLPQALYHRDPQHIVACQPRVGRGAGHLRLPAGVLAGVPGLEVALVRNRNLVHVLQGDRPALALVAVQLNFIQTLADYRGELFGQIKGVVDAAVHAHAAERIVEVRGVAGEKAAPLAVALRHPLMHRIERAMAYLVSSRTCVNAVKATLYRSFGNGLLVLFLLAHGKHRAPHAGDAQEEEPFFGIGEVGDVAEPGQGGGEVERRARDEEALRPGEAFEPDAERFAHAAAPAVRADEPLRLDLPFFVYAYRDRSRVLAYVGDGAAEFDASLWRETLGQHLVQPVLLALHPEGMSGLVGDHAEVELRHPSRAVAVLQPRRRAPHLDQALRRAEAREHVERGRLEGGGAQVLRQARLGLEHRHRHAGVCEHVRRAETDRPGAGDDDCRLHWRAH